MSQSWLRATILTSPLLVLGCASTLEVSPSNYTPPGSDPPLAKSGELLGSIDATLSRAAKNLQSRGFTSDHGGGENFLVARYSGDLNGLVDCGQLTVPGETSAQSASAAQISIAAFPDRPGWKALRQMRLDARSVTKTRPSAGGFLARTDTAYVVTRTIDTISATGAVLGTDREIISFESGGVGLFENGLACQPTGALEDRVGAVVAEAASFGGGIDGLTPIDEALPVTAEPAASITTTQLLETELPALLESPPLEQVPSDTATADVVGSVGVCDAFGPDEKQNLAPGGCAFQRFADEKGQAAHPDFSVAVAGGDEGLLAGSPLTLEVNLPGGDRYFHVAYLASDGLVYHAGPKFIDRSGVGERFLYQTNFELVANERIELILALSSEVELFPFERPESEPALDFLAFMNERFSNDSSGLAVLSIRRDPPS